MLPSVESRAQAPPQCQCAVCVGYALREAMSRRRLHHSSCCLFSFLSRHVPCISQSVGISIKLLDDAKMLNSMAGQTTLVSLAEGSQTRTSHTLPAVLAALSLTPCALYSLRSLL